MSILRRLTVAGTALALTLLGLVFPTMAVAQERAAFPGAIDLPTWIMKGRKPIESGATPQDNWVVTGKVVTYLSGERAGSTDDKDEKPIPDIDVFARYQANNGAWSPIFKTTTTATTSPSKTNRPSNYAIKMRDFVDYNGELGQFRPGEGKAQRLQVWIDPKQVPGYRLTFSERTGGVIQGYSTPKDFNWTASQMMQWGYTPFGKSTQVSQMNIGLIKVANSEAELNLGKDVKIEPSLTNATAKKTLKGYVRWENQTLNRGGGNAYVGRANIEDYSVNTPVEGYVVVAAVKDKNNRVEARCTTTKNLPNDNGKTPNWTIYFKNDVDVKHMKFQVFTGSCEDLQKLPELMAYWSPFTDPVGSWGTKLDSTLGSSNQGWTGTRWEDNVRVLLRPLQMQLLPHGESLGTDSGTQSFYGDKVQVDYSRLPLNTELEARLYKGNLSDSGSGTAVQSVPFKATGIKGSIEFPTALTDDTFKEYWVDVVPKNIPATSHPEWQVLASQSFLYKPIQLAISPGVVNENGTFAITQKAPDADSTGVKLTRCEVVSDKLIDATATKDSLPYKLTRDTSTGDGCTLTGMPEKSGVHSLWVKFTFTDAETKSHTIVQYLPWTVVPKLKPQIEPGTPDSEVSKYSPLDKFPAVGVSYYGLVSPFPDWQGRHFTYQVFDTEPVADSVTRKPDTGGMVNLRNGNVESGLKFNTATGQVTGTTQEHKSAVFWVKATDEDGGVTPAMKYEIHPGTPLILQRAQLPTGSGGSVYQNANGTPVVIWVSGGEPSATELTTTVNGVNTTLPRNAYADAEILGVYDGDANQVSGSIGGISCEPKDNSGGGKFILCSGTPYVSKATTYYLQVKYTDKNGRTLNGAKYTLPQVKALTTLNGSEGWLKMTLLPKITADTDPGADTSTDLPDGTKGTDYGTKDVKSYLSGGTGKFANYTFSAAGLPAGLTMDADGVITGKPLETTKQEGVSVKVYLRGKDGTAAERSSTSVTFHLRIKTDLKATTETLSATAQGGTTYTSGKPLLDVSSDAGITGGVSPYSYKLQYKDGNGSWQNATTSGGRYQVPNADTNHNPSGLLLDSNGKLVGATMGTAGFPQLRVVVTDSDTVSCTGGCSVNVGLDLSRTDTRKPTVATDASITANVGETVTGFLPVDDPSGKPTNYKITSQVNLPKGVTLSVVETTGEYTLTATPEAVAGKSGSVTLDVTGANGVVGHVTLLIHVVDQRTPHQTNNTVAISLEQGIPVPATAKVTGAIDAENSPKVECFVPANYTSANCPNAPQKLPGLAGVTLNPDGTLTGTPVKDDVGEHQVPLKALGVNGKWSAEFSVKITVSPSTLVFEPGIAPGGTKGQAYEWTFNPATGAEGLTKTYKVYLGNQRVNGCSVDTSGTKPKLTCPDGALTNGETYTLRVSAGTGTAAVSIDRVFTPEIYPPLKFESYDDLPSAAVGAVYQQQDGSTFRFTASGGSGSYGFGFATGSGHTQPTAPHSCTGWALYTTENKDSGLCLERDGRVTGTPKEAGTIDLSKLEVTDSAQHRAGLPEGATAQLVIHPLLQLTNMCVKPESGPDKHDNYKCKGEKNQPVGTNGKLKIATVSGGATPYRNLRVKGLDAYNDGVTDPAQQLKADWCDGAPTTKAGEDICLTGTWPKTMAPGSSLNIYVTGAAGRTVTVEAFIPVATDLKFIDNPRGVPGGVTLKQTSGNAKPDNIDQTTWDKVSDSIDNNLPTIGINLDKSAVTGNSLTLPSLVTGGVSLYTYLTVPCDNTDASGNCALGDTGLFLNKSTGQLVGIPKPGASAAVVVSVTDSDSPAQTKKSNLVFSIADTRKPKVTATTINAEVDKEVSQVIPVSDGSGQYASVTPTGMPGWMTLALENNVLTVTATPGPGHVTSAEGGTFSVTVTDKNGNTSEPATIKYTVVDNRVPDLSSLKGSGSGTDLTGTEGKSVQGWTDLPKDATGYGPKIKEWKVEGLPKEVTFNSKTGKLENKIASGESGTYPITITATTENGKTTTIVKKLVVTPSDLAVTEADAGNLTSTLDLAATTATIATVSGGTGHYTVEVTGLPSDLRAEHDGNGNIVLKGSIPNEDKDYSVTITVRDKDGVERTLTRPLHIGKGLSVAKTTMPTATIGIDYGSQCLGVSGGTPGYSVDVKSSTLPTGMTLAANDDGSDICLKGTPSGNAGAVQVTFTLKDSANNPQATKDVKLTIPVNDEFTASGPTAPIGTFYAGSAIKPFTPTTGSGDSCYGLNESGGCQSATFTYAASGLPAGLSINPRTGEISGKPTELDSNRTVTVTVASSAPGSAATTKQFQITVASAFSDPDNRFNVTPSTTVPKLDENGTVETDNPSNQVLPVPEIKNGQDTIATGKYSIEHVSPDSQGNYPLGDTGLSLTPDGKLVGTLKPGQPPAAGSNGTFNLGQYQVVLKDNAGGGQIGPQTVTFTVTDTRTPQITVNSATVEVGQAADISIGVTGGSGQIDTVELTGCKQTNTNVKAEGATIKVSAGAFTEGGKMECQVKVTDHNGSTKTEQFTIKVNDSRQPKFNTYDRERYAWQGLDFTNVTLGNNSKPGIPVMTWLVDPSKDPTAAPLQSVKIAGLPEQFKVMSVNSEAAKDTNGAYTCDTPTDCTIVDYATQDFSGVQNFTLTITANTKKPNGDSTGLTASKSIPLRVFASPLQLNTSTPTGMIRADGGKYASSVGTVDYRGTITSTAQAGTALINNPSAWDGTYALDSKAKYEIVKVTAYKRDGKSENVGKDKLTLRAADSSDAAMPMGSQRAKTLTLSSKNTGAIPEGTTSLAVELKVTDGHGIVRSATVNIPVVQKLEWAGPPFNRQGDPVTLDNGVQGAPYPAYYAEAKGGDGSFSTSLAEENAEIRTAADADAKAKFLHRPGYKGIDPVYCAAQGEPKSDTRPKCFPIPGLSGTIPANAWNNPVPADYQGLFMLSNGKLSGSIPPNAKPGTHTAQVLVIDGSGQLIKKTFSITVEQKLTLTIKNNELPKGKKGICYGSDVKPNSDKKCPLDGLGSGVKVGDYAGPDDIKATCELIPPVTGLAVTCKNGEVTISGAPTQTYDGKATVKVTLTGGAGQSVEKTVPLLIETDMIFKGKSTEGATVDVKTDPDGTQKIQVDTAADGKKFPNMKLDIEGGVGPFTYYVENSDGTAVSPVPCPAGVTASPNSSKPLVCYPIGTTGLVLDSEGNVHGTPIPGGSAEGNFVVADSDTTSRTKKAAITVNIADKRPPKVYDLTLNTTVGASTLGSAQLVKEDPQNPSVDLSSSNTWTSEQVRAANQKGFHTREPSNTLGKVESCSAGSKPGWLTVNSDGVISLANNQPVSVDAAGKTLTFCVWYVGPNGVNAPKPAVVSVKVTDQRRATIGDGNGDTTNAKIGEKLADSATPKPLIEVTIPADMVGNTTKTITVTKLNPDGTDCTGPSCKFTSDGANFTDTSIDDLTFTGLNCTGTGDSRSCSVKVSGTPKPSAAGDHKLSYRITLPNGQTQIISHTLHIPHYDLALSVEPMNPAVVGLDYLQISKAVMAVGGSGKYWFQLWDPNNKPAKVGDMSLVTTGNQVKLKWTPTADDLAKAQNGNIPVTITVWDKTHCGINNLNPGQPGPDNCPYKVTKTVNIPLHAAPVTKDITVPEVTEGTRTPAPSVYTGSDEPELTLYSTVPTGNKDLFEFDPDSGVVTLKDTARPGTYTAVIRITLPGVAIPFYRNVTFTVKEKPVPEPTDPTPTPSSTPEPRPGVAPISPSIGITYPVRDLDTLVVRHGGNDRIDTSLAVLDFFSAKSSTPTEANNLTVAYADYAGKVSLPWSDTAVLVRDDDYPDALVAGPLAANYNAPILMTPTKQVPHRVVNALRTHGFTKVILVGNPGAISAGAASQLQNAGFQVQRLGGQDRYRTAGVVADHLLAARGRDKSDVYLATGVDYPDALSASSAAIKNVGVVLLTPRRTVDGTSQGWMNSAKAAKVVAVGGPAVTAAERSVHLDEKQVGVDRYETAEKVASAYFPPNPGRIAVATGKDFPDATLAASLTARTGSPLVLTRTDTLTKPTTQFLTRNRASVRKVDVVGGKAAVTEKVRGEIYSALR